jgi:membrane-bound serine protease (ClpP class)
LGALFMPSGLGGIHAAEIAPVPVPARIVYVIPIRDEIEPSLVYLVRRGVREAVAKKAVALVLNMNTNGGRTDSMEEIVRALETFPDQNATYTYIDKKAASAGAFISSATRHIYMAPGSVIGAATPVMVSGDKVEQLPESYEKKIVSFFEASGRATAERHGHNPAVFAAMVDRERGLTVDGDEIVAKGSILTLTNTEAEKKYGHPPQNLLSDGTVPTLDVLTAQLGGPGVQVVTLEPTGFEKLGRFLTLVAPFLLTAGMILGYLEFKAPGTMLFGVLAALCFLLFFFGQYVAGLSGWEPVVLFLVGIALVAVEFFLLPGLVLPVVTGLLLIITAFLYAMSNHAPGAGLLPSLGELRGPLLRLFLSVAMALGVIALLARTLSDSKLFTRALEKATPHGAAVLDRPALAVRIGEEGEALTLLRPAGTARIGERRVDVVSEGDYIAAGSRVRVTQVEGIRVVVKSA